MDEYTIPNTQLNKINPAPNTIIFYNTLGGGQTEVLRISKEGITANPDVPVDEAAQAIIRALDGYIKSLTKHPWVGLADEEIADLIESTDYYNFPEDLIINTQTKLRDINT